MFLFNSLTYFFAMDRSSIVLSLTRCLLSLSIVWPVVGGFSAVHSASAFSIISSPQSWIGGGNSFLVTQEDGFSFNGYLDSGTTASLSINGLDWRTEQPIPTWWTLDLAAPDYSPLTVGFYQNAKHYPFQGDSFPGINFEGNGRSNSTVTGSFEIFELVANPDGTILSFAADFTQFDEDIDDWWNRGSLRINSDFPLTLLASPVPEPPPVSPPSPDPLPFDPPPLFGGEPSPGMGRNFPLPDPWFSDPPLVGSPGTPVPGPLPVAAALAGWNVSRNLRRRCRDRS